MTVLINFDKRSSLGEIIERWPPRAGYRLWLKRLQPRRPPPFCYVDPETELTLLDCYKKRLEEYGRHPERDVILLGEEIRKVESRIRNPERGLVRGDSWGL